MLWESFGGKKEEAVVQVLDEPTNHTPLSQLSGVAIPARQATTLTFGLHRMDTITAFVDFRPVRLLH